MTFARRRVGSLTIRGDRAGQTMLGKEMREKFGAGLTHSFATAANRDRRNENFNAEDIGQYPKLLEEDIVENWPAEYLARQSVELKRNVQTRAVSFTTLFRLRAATSRCFTISVRFVALRWS